MAKSGTLKDNVTGEVIYPTTLASNVYGINGTSPLSLALYPIDSIYMSTANVSPASFFGGVWTPIKDVFLLTAGDTYIAGATGGSATHTLTINEIPSHDHTFETWYSKGGTADKTYHGVMDYNGKTWWNVNTFYTQKAGGGQAHNNMPPYLVVYAWKRVS